MTTSVKYSEAFETLVRSVKVIGEILTKPNDYGLYTKAQVDILLKQQRINCHKAMTDPTKEMWELESLVLNAPIATLKQQ